ncbi:vascular cell adhesion protein 1 [Ascaphus truei]|uniref:vascular cell adhesion protein 1 n=1 Tax=Ascaphus truei TaxID=8439 RepID=UPI003F5947AE
MSGAPILPVICLQVLFITTSAFHITLSPSQTAIAGQIGESLLLTCEAFGCPDPSFVWRTPEDKTLSGTVNNEGGKSLLTMTNVSAESDGYYTCKAMCEHEKPDERRIKISVYSLPKDPVLETSPLLVGVQTHITCTVPHVYPTERLSAQILRDGEVVDEFEVPEPVGVSTLKDIVLSYDFTPTERDEGGEIACVATMPFGEEIDPKIRRTAGTITLSYPPGDPHIMGVPPGTVSEGEQISLRCTADSRNPPTGVRWVKLDGEVESPRWSEENGDLTLLRADPRDSGIYICYAENKWGRKSAHVNISVQGEPRVPHISIEPSTTVTEGQEVRILCSVRGGPDTDVTLWKVTEAGERQLQDIEGTVFIQKAEPRNAGVYRCHAVSPYGEREATESLIVQYSPRNTVISASPSSVNEGDTVTLSCDSDGIPTPKTYLRQRSTSGKSVLLSEGPSVTLTGVQNPSDGVYECEARNSLGSDNGTVELIVRVPPRNTQVVIAPSAAVREGEPVLISCTSEAWPAPALILKKKTGTGLTELASERGVHAISHARPEHTGTYVCESRNVAGQQVADAVLTVQVPPRNTTVVVTPSENVTEGDTITITCETYSFPSATIILQKVCAGNSTILQSNNGTFTLHNVTRNDTGTYTVSVLNEVGNDTEVIEIIVQERLEGSSSRFVTPLIVVSLAAVSAGVSGLVIHKLKSTKLQGSYSLVNALRGIV